MSVTFTEQQMVAACRKYGPGLGPLPAGVDGVQLLWSLSGKESSYGKNTKPRHEPAYDRGGSYATHAPMPALLARFGAAAACSYGPWQLMFCEAPAGATPKSFDDLDFSAQATAAFLNSHMRAQHPVDVAAIGRMYNGGNVNTMAFKAIMYGHSLHQMYYDSPIPEAV